MWSLLYSHSLNVASLRGHCSLPLHVPFFGDFSSIRLGGFITFPILLCSPLMFLGEFNSCSFYLSSVILLNFIISPTQESFWNSFSKGYLNLTRHIYEKFWYIWLHSALKIVKCFFSLKLKLIKSVIIFSINLW